MGTNEKTPEELARELEEQKQATEAQVEQAGDKAREQAENQGLTEEEVNKKVEHARREEKDKLYPQLNALKDSIKEIQEVLRAEREEKETIKREAAEKEERARQSKLSDSERQLEAIRNIEEQLRTEREERKAMQLELDREREKQRLENYRKRVIQAAGNKIIPDLVRGNTEAEIDESLNTAKARYEEIVAQVRSDQGDRVRSDLGRSSANPDTAALEEQEIEELQRSVDMDKYMQDPAYRKKIQDQLASTYSKLAGRV